MRDKFGIREFVVSGITTTEGFHHWGVVRNLTNEQGVYIGVIGSADPEKIGMTQEQYEEKIKLVGRVSVVMDLSLDGYQGYTSCDVMEHYNGSGTPRDIIVDHNHRRGGRSVLEVLIALRPNDVFIDMDYTFIVPDGHDSTEFAAEIITKAYDRGCFVYGTPTIYYPVVKDDK